MDYKSLVNHNLPDCLSTSINHSSLIKHCQPISALLYLIINQHWPTIWENHCQSFSAFRSNLIKHYPPINRVMNCDSNWWITMVTFKYITTTIASDNHGSSPPYCVYPPYHNHYIFLPSSMVTMVTPCHPHSATAPPAPSPPGLW